MSSNRVFVFIIAEMILWSEDIPLKEDCLTVQNAVYLVNKYII